MLNKLIKKNVVYSVLGLALTIVFGVTGHSLFVLAETNTVSVEACENTGGGVRISRGGSWSTLANGCRDAGHGYRNYQLQCVSEKSYQVSWQSCSGPVSTPVFKPIPVLINEPVSEIQPQTETPPQSITQPAAPEPVPVPVVQQPTNTPLITQPVVQTIECSGHGWLHDEHCHCDSGYYPSGVQCLVIPTTQIITQPVVSQPVIQQPSIQPVVDQVISQPIPQSTITVPECSGHGWLHGEHCHCDTGYYPSGVQCLAVPVVTTQNPIQTQTQTQIQSPSNVVTAPVVVKVTPASIPKNQVNNVPKTINSVTKSIECSGHGWLHGEHCHCDTGYYPSGVQCLAVSKVENKTSVTQVNEKKILPPLIIANENEKDVKQNLDQCGGHGRSHGDHCDCNDGYFENAGKCIPLPSSEQFKLKNGALYAKEDFWSPYFNVEWFNWDNRIALHWESPTVPYDGFFVYLSPHGFPGKLSDYEPIVFSKYQNSYLFTPEETGEYTAYVIPFVYLAEGNPRLLGTGAISKRFISKPNFSFAEQAQSAVYKIRLSLAEWIKP